MRIGLLKQDHFDPAKGPKRILALDGGGIRGILTLEFLKIMETLVKQRLGEGALLCDYFDLIGGTSTGSIIAAGLARGMTPDALQGLYRNIGASVFQPGGLAKFIPKSLRGKLAPKFPSEPLRRELERQLGAETTLDSDKIRTGLMIMTKRLDTGSPWPSHNGGRGNYAVENGALRLTQIVLASAAAPTYFASEEIVIHSRDGTAVEGAFVDGFVTPFNDPALQPLMQFSLDSFDERDIAAASGLSEVQKARIPVNAAVTTSASVSHAFKRSASKCQGKWPDQTLPSTKRSGYRDAVAVDTSRLSCKTAGKTRTLMPVWDSSGESRLRQA
jgi:patatin-like phospholipase/acyl hydrolase